ncbi:MAG: hypothetical protein ACLTT1_11085 [[Clostridium] scindens]
MDTMLHEELEVRIARKYNINDLPSDAEIHKYINRVIQRIFKAKGWDYDKAR